MREVPSGSLDPEASSVTVAPSVGVWSDPALAVGASLSAVTVIVTVSVVAEFESLTETWKVTW